MGENLTYEDLLPQATSMEIGEGRRVYVLSPEAIIDQKSRFEIRKEIPRSSPPSAALIERIKKHLQ
jgi:hypothetical protein